MISTAKLQKATSEFYPPIHKSEDCFSPLPNTSMNLTCRWGPFLIFAPMMQPLLQGTLRLFVVFIALMFWPKSAQTQPGLSGSDLWPKGEAGKDYNLNNASNQKDGPWIRVWPNGNLYYIGTFNAGIPVGEFTFFHETGEVLSKVVQTSGGKRAFTKLYRTDGTLQAEGLYLTSQDLDENGEAIRKKQGEWKYYDQQAQLRLVENYANDLLNGLTQRMARQGQLLEAGEYILGNRDGIWKNWDETGLLLSEIGYDNGHFHGMCRVSHSNGRPRSIGMYRDGKETGFWKTFTESGVLENTRQFEDGELVKEIHENGKVLLTFPDGRPKEEFNVVNRKKEGPFREWHDSGAWAMEEEVDPISGEAFFRRVLDGEIIRKEGEYVDGMLDGEVYHYDQNGRLQLIELYENGKLVGSDPR